MGCVYYGFYEKLDVSWAVFGDCSSCVNGFFFFYVYGFVCGVQEVLDYDEFYLGDCIRRCKGGYVYVDLGRQVGYGLDDFFCVQVGGNGRKFYFGYNRKEDLLWVNKRFDMFKQYR